MNEHPLLPPVIRALDALKDAACAHDGLLPSVMARDTGRMLDDLPDPIEGQRMGDRAPRGCNLMHDHPVLRLWREAGAALDRRDLVDAADRYLLRFATHCCHTPSGLFPWGEHAYWRLDTQAIGNSYELRPHGGPLTHDHLNQAPRWLWEALWKINPNCVKRFAAGLDYHWIDEARTEYIRHAPLDAGPRHGGRDEPRSCDFPRHSGHYLFDLAFVLAKSGDSARREQLVRFADYWWPRRHETGTLYSESRSTPERRGDKRLQTMQTLSLAVSMLEAAAMLDEGGVDPGDGASGEALPATLRMRANTYLDGVMSMPHEPARGRFATMWDPEYKEVGMAPVWGSVYGVPPAAAIGVLAAAAHRLTGRHDVLGLAEAIGCACSRRPIPEGPQIPARDVGLTLELMAELAELDGDEGWRRAGERLGESAVDLFLDAPLPRAAAGADWYESQTNPAYLLHGLARVAAVALSEGGEPFISPDATRR